MWRERLLDFLFPKRAVCMGCGSAAGFDEDWLCPDCRRSLALNWVGAFRDDHLDGAASAYAYRGAAGRVVRMLKYRDATALSDMMAANMVLAYAQIMPTGAELVTAVPMHPKRRRRQGYNHAELLARSVAARLELPYDEALIRVRNTPQQARLEGDARRKNLIGAFRATDSMEGRRILLVDDVFTTGATAWECAKTLRAAGARSVSFLSYARSGGEG